MCGITGFVGFEDRKLLRKMTEVLNYRGPDDTGYYSDKHCSLGMKRLSILDLKKGIYPIANENRSIFTVYNGEIYNFKSIRTELQQKGHRFNTDCDGEVIVHAYEQWGLSFVSKLNGMFAIAIWDTKKRQLILIRDRLGIKPLYYTIDNGQIFFSSEAKSLLLRKEQAREINTTLISTYLQYRYVPEPETLFKGIKKVPKSSIMIYGDGKVIIKQYWKLKYDEQSISEPDACKKINEEVTSAIEKRLISDVPLGIFLSGGLDSNLIAATVAKIKGSDTKTFSLGYNLPNFSDELSLATQVAQQLGTDHREIIMKDPSKLLNQIIWHLDEPIADPSAIPQYLLSKEAKKHVTVALVGHGADEVFGGYEQYRFMLLANKYRSILNRIPKKVIGQTLNVIPKDLLNKFFPYAKQFGPSGIQRATDFLTHFNFTEKDYLKLVSIFTPVEAKRLNPTYVTPKTKDATFANLNGMLKFDADTFLTHLLSGLDKVSMANSLEARVPYLDHQLVEAVAKMPTQLKIKGLNEKYILKKIAYNRLGKRILNQKKKRFFVPIVPWLDGEVGEIAKSVLLQSNFFDKTEIHNLFKSYGKSPLYCARQIWTLLTLELWNKQFIEQGVDKNKKIRI
jgi:asparagine synthase (glutamine-hydrolysing)